MKSNSPPGRSHRHGARLSRGGTEQKSTEPRSYGARSTEPQSKEHGPTEHGRRPAQVWSKTGHMTEGDDDKVTANKDNQATTLSPGDKGQDLEPRPRPRQTTTATATAMSTATATANNHHHRKDPEPWGVELLKLCDSVFFTPDLREIVTSARAQLAPNPIRPRCDARQQHGNSQA